ncbi:MAG: hypothetical protein P4M09_11080 [Devosia sp.]|nr:hypothetical protein [Devosia sp.]
METNLSKNKLGYWYVNWSEPAGDGTWRSKRVSTRSKSRKEAEAFRDAWVAGLKEDATQAAAAKVPTIGELIDEYVELHVEANKKAKSQAQSLVFPKRVLGHELADALDAKALVDYRVSRKRADGTLRRELLALTAVLNWAAKHKKLAKDKIPAIDLPPEGQARTRHLSAEEELIFHAEAMGDSVGKKTLSRVTRFVAIALDTGARKEAIETLTWDRVDLAHKMIDFRDARPASRAGAAPGAHRPMNFANAITPQTPERITIGPTTLYQISRVP